MPEQMTTQVTASTEVARVPPAVPGRPADPLTSIAWVVAGVMVALGALNLVLDIVGKARAWWAAREQRDEGELAALEKRLGARIDGIVEDNRGFRASADIDRDMAAFRRDLDHEKVQRVANGEAAAAGLAADRQRLSELERGQTRIETKVEGQAVGLQRVENAVEKLRSQIDDLPARLAAVLNKA